MLSKQAFTILYISSSAKFKSILKYHFDVTSHLPTSNSFTSDVADVILSDVMHVDITLADVIPSDVKRDDVTR